jgi:hypothetical protein
MGLFGPRRDEVTGSWRKLHNVELHSFYSPSSIIGMIKSRKMRWAGNVKRMGYWWESRRKIPLERRRLRRINIYNLC